MPKFDVRVDGTFYINLIVEADTSAEAVIIATELVSDGSPYTSLDVEDVEVSPYRPEGEEQS